MAFFYENINAYPLTMYVPLKPLHPQVQPFKATDVRIWLSSALYRIGKSEQAIEALDMDSDLKEHRYMMNKLLLLYAGKISLDEMLEVLGSADNGNRDLLGDQFYGSFYLGLYFDSQNEQDLCRAFLDVPANR